MIKNNNQPTLKEWKKLYELAVKFEKLAPWNWMCDIDIFGIMDPRTKETAYCSVMGNNGEFYGLGVYPGAEGFKSLDSLSRGDVPDDINGQMHTQKCLMMAYTKRDYITKEEMEIIKSVGARFDNRNFWPTFKDYTPGYHPWFISGQDAGFLITVVEQALGAVLDFKKNKDEFIAHIPEKIFVKTPKEKKGKIFWHYEYLAPEKYIKRDKMPVLNEVDEILARNIKKEAEMDHRIEWELDYFRTPKPIRDDNEKYARPYYPYMFFMVDHISGMVLNASLVNFEDDEVRVFRRLFIDAIKKSGILPRGLLIRKYELAAIMRPVADIFGIEIKMSDDMGMLDEAKNSFARNT